MPKPILNAKGIQDFYTRDNFQKLIDYFQTENQLSGFAHIEAEVDSAENHVKIAHGLGYTPKDIIMTKVVGTGTITFNYSLFDEIFLDVSFNGPARFRAFVGTYWRDISQNQETDIQVQQVKASV